MTRMRTVLLLVVASLVLTGCANAPTSFIAQVPTSGPIEQGQLVSNTSADQFIRVIARPPQPGMSPTEIVQGFLDASASFDGDHAVARTYLTREAAETWSPSSGVSVYDGLPTLVEAGAAVLMSASMSGRISEIGRYSVESPGTDLRTSFFLTQRGGEWRINQPPNGLLLSSFDVSRAYRSYSVYFFNPSFDTLVPDPRLVPVIGPALPTTLMQRLIAGPNEWLQPAVRTGFPAGVGLAIDAVTIDGGVARVSLGQSVQLANDNARIAMSQQIVWTLRQLPEIQSVEILSGGAPLLVPGAPNPQPRDLWPSVDPGGLPTGSHGFVATSNGLIRLTPEGNFAVPGALGTTDLEIVQTAVAQDSGQVTVLDSTGAMSQSRTIIGSPVVQRPNGDSAITVSYDGSTTIWLVDVLGRVFSMASNGDIFPIEIVGLADTDRVVGIYPSRDGTRAVAIVDNGVSSNVVMVRVTRPSAANITRISLQEPIRIESKLTDVIDVAWSSANTVAVIGSESAGALQGYEIDLSRGEVIAQGSPEDPVTIAAAPGLPTLIASADGKVYENSTGLWIERITGAAPAYPG
ncbi:MAG: GerMN domain-containing protein [Candidatus Nanopelagicales bacterium]|nr:GerMN domain-containing protein [Candidatus Nanopelagicales bacterium]